jgi:ATP-dependent exoDNAse (exonuclease V) beta subunit
MPLTRPGTHSVSVESIGTDFTRPHGKRFGTLVHTVLSIVPFDSDLAAIREITRLQGRIFGATEDEIAAAITCADKTLRHDLLRRAAAAEICRREVSVTMKLEGGVIIEGTVDLAFRTNDAPWTVVDYKTDFEIQGRLEEYQTQVGLYAEAISRATGVNATGILLKL